jgi:hypothetical protein
MFRLGLTAAEVESWLNDNTTEAVAPQLTDEEIVNYINEPELDEEPLEPDTCQPRVISSTAAITQCENLMAYARANNFSIDFSLIMTNFKEKAGIAQLNKKVQTKLTDFPVTQSQPKIQNNHIKLLFAKETPPNSQTLPVKQSISSYESLFARESFAGESCIVITKK